MRLPITNSSKFAIVDDDYDGEWLATFRWILIAGSIPATAISWTQWNNLGEKIKFSRQERTWSYLRRMAYGESLIPPGWQVKNKNGDPLDCRTSNLECLSASDLLNRYRKQSHHRANESGFRGVVVVNGSARAKLKAHYITNPQTGGLVFPTLGDAARAYDQAARAAYGDRATLNYPEDYR